MSFKNFSSEQQTKSDNKTAAAPNLAIAVDQPQPQAAQPTEAAVPPAKR